MCRKGGGREGRRRWVCPSEGEGISAQGGKMGEVTGRRAWGLSIEYRRRN